MIDESNMLMYVYIQSFQMNSLKILERPRVDATVVWLTDGHALFSVLYASVAPKLISYAC